MTNTKTIKREKRIVLYAKIGFIIFAILAAIQNRPEFLGAVIGWTTFTVIRFFIFNSTRYTYLYDMYKRGEYPPFVFVQAAMVLGIMISLLVVLFVYFKFYIAFMR